MAKKKTEDLRPYDLGLYKFEDMYVLFTLTAYFVKKHNVQNIVEFYKKIIPNHTDYEVEFYERIDKTIRNITRCTMNANVEYNNMELSDKDILKRISGILNNILPF